MAKFLELAGDAVKKREIEISANHQYFRLNEAQCRRLWQNLRAVYGVIAPSLSYSLSVQQKYLPLHKEFYSIVMRADGIVDKCSNEQSWLKEAIFLGGNRQIFQELSEDLENCVDLFCYLTKSLCRDSLIPTPSNVVDGVFLVNAASDENLQKDITSLMTRLEEKQTDFGEQEKHLASYIVDRACYIPEPDIPVSETLPFYEVHREDPIHVNILGAGAYGAVSKVKWLGLTCAKKEFLDVESTAGFVKEVDALVALNHSRIVKLLCSSRKMPNPYFIMELMPMSLDAFYKKTDRSDNNMRFEILPSVDMMLQISLGMEYLHEQGLVHRDLKSLNILVSPSAHPDLRSEGYADIKLTDFGLAKMKVSDASMLPTGRMGTRQWSAPEVLAIPGSPLHRVDWRKVDTYSFAIVCSEILTGQTPYCGMGVGKEMLESVSLGQLRPKLPQDCPIYLSRLLSQCWAQNPKDRPTFKEITETLNGFKTCLLMCTVPPEPREQAPVTVFEKFWTFMGVFKNKVSVRTQVFCPDPEERELVEAAVDYIYGRMKMMEALCDSMKENLKMAQICHVQGGYLVREYLEGFQKVKAVFNLVTPSDFWKLYRTGKLQQFSGSMDRLICSMMAVEELLRACGGSKWKLTALIRFAALPETKAYCSIFGLYLRNLYWNLFVINHVMHDVTARQPSTTLQLLTTSSTVRVEWCEARCELVLRRVTGTGREDAEDEFLQADADRQAEDRKNLILSLVNYSTKNFLLSRFAYFCRCLFSMEEQIEYGLERHLKNKLQSASAPFDCMSYKLDDLILEDGVRIGSGSSKGVFKQKWCGEMVAVGRVWMEYDTGYFMPGVSMLATLQHPSVVHLIGWKLDDGSPIGYILMELMEQDLRRLIARNSRLYRGSPFSLLVTIDILLQVVEAMIHIHKCGVIYGDLKPTKILVNPKYTTKSNAEELDVYYTVKLTYIDTSLSTTGVIGTLRYSAPEVTYEWEKGGNGYTFSADVYSFGMTAFQVATGYIPFESKPWREVVTSVNQGERPRFPVTCYGQGLKELIEKCWAGTPEDRPCFEQIRKDLWTLKYREEIQR